MSDIAIKVEHLTKEYQIGLSKSGDLRESFGNKLGALFNSKQNTETFTALDDVSFEVKKGEAVGIIGRNGAGKSTLLKILSRITEPTKGRFEINGRVSSLLEIGTGFHPELSGRENIFLNGTILGMKRAEIKAKFDEILAFSGVEKFIDTPVKHYSSGMKVRLAFSVAAHLEPEILIIDEVLAVGDAEFQKKCLGKMDDVSKNEGRTVIFVSHNMGAVKKLCSRGLLLNAGCIQQIDSIDKIVNTYIEESSGDKLIFEKSFKKQHSHVQHIKLITKKSKNVFYYDDKIRLSLDFILEMEEPDLDINIAVWDFEVKLFMFFASDLAKKGYNQPTPFKKGKNNLSFEIPREILNDGRYYIHFAMHKSYTDFLHTEKNALVFDLVNEGNFSSQYRTGNNSKLNIKANNIIFK